jgi:ABC-type multidrug transport system ATPase subunit
MSERGTQVQGRAQEPLLKITNINKTFEGGSQVIRDFNLEIMPGEVMCLLGNNGSGKTTLINLLTGLCSPDKVNESDETS